MKKNLKAIANIFILSLIMVSIESLAVISGADQSKGNQASPTNDVIVKPKLITDSCGEAIYPSISKRNGEEGKVGVQLWINESGNVVTAKIAVSSGFPALDEGAIRFLSNCKFEPATKNGLPIAVWYPLSYRWRLANNEDEQHAIKGGNYNFEDTSKSMNLMRYVRESCVNFVSGFNNNEAQDNEHLGVKKLAEADVCGCAENKIKADKYLKLLAVEPAPDISKIMDEDKFRIYLPRRNTAIMMECLAKSIDASISKLDPLKSN